MKTARNRTLCLAAALLAALAAPSARAVLVDETQFDYQVPITVTGYAGETTLTDFPILVTLATDAPAGFGHSLCAADGTDIRFADADGNLVPHEIESWNPSGTSYVWVKVPSLAGTATALTMYFGADDPSMLPAVEATEVWSRYVVVIHGGPLLTNAVGNAAPAVTAGSDKVAGIASPGVAGGGIRKIANNATGVNVANPSGKLSSSQRFSVSGWFKRNGNGKGGTHILAASRTSATGTYGFTLKQDSGAYLSVTAKNNNNWTSGDYALADQTWGHVAFTYRRNGALASFFDGNPDQTQSSPGSVHENTADGYWSFGSYAGGAGNNGDNFVGDMDELRIYDGEASADWIKAEHDSVAAPSSFAVLGAVAPADPDAPVFGACSASVSGGDVRFSVELASLAAPTAVSLFYSADGGATFAQSDLGTVDAATTLQRTLRKRDAGAYVWYARAVSTVAGTDRASQSPRKTFAVARAKEPKSTYRFFTATVAYDGAAASGVPALLRLAEGEGGIEGFRYADVAESGLEILDADGNLLPWELDTWDTNGVSLVWVGVPAYSNGVAVTVRYGAGFVNATPAATDVWSGYAGVWHLNDTNAASAWGSYPNATSAAGLDGEKAAVSLADEPGRFGKSVRINGATSGSADQNYGGVFVNDSGMDSPLDFNGRFTLSGWFKHADSTYAYDALFFKRQSNTSPGSAFAVRMMNGNTKINFCDVTLGGGTSNQVYAVGMSGTWQHLTFVYDGTDFSYYENGRLKAARLSSKASDNNERFCFGNTSAGYGEEAGYRAWRGWIDEVRVAGGARTADWIAAEHHAMADENAFVYSSVEIVPVYPRGTTIIVR